MSSFEATALGLWGGKSEDIIKRDFPIHRACRDGDVEALRMSWAIASHDQLKAEDKFYGWTPIHWAAYFGKIQCIDALLDFGVGANLTTSKFKQTPCHIASFGGHPQCLLRLLRGGANFLAQDYLGETPLHKAARVGNVESIRVLLEKGSRVNLCNNNGHTPCDLARMQGFHECVNLLETPSHQSMHQHNNFGASGQYMGALTGLANGHGINGNQRTRKRVFDDESIPNFKRGKFDISNECDANEVTMDMEDELPTNGNGKFQVAESGDLTNQFPRAPSPGMDIQLQTDMDMQLWCHQNGYGDTAEIMPPQTNGSCLKHRPVLKTETGYDRAACVTLRGMQSRGWH